MKVIGKFLEQEGRFIAIVVLFFAAILTFHDNPQIAMWIGFILAGYSAEANDSIQTLGTFFSSNKKQKESTCGYSSAASEPLLLQ